MWKKFGLMMGLCGVLMSCGNTPASEGPAMTPVATNPPQPTITPVLIDTQATPVPATPSALNPTSFAVPTSTPSNIDAVDATAIAATIEAAMPATATPDASGLLASLQGETAVVGLFSNADTTFFATITTGMLENYDDPHPLVIYAKTNTGYTEVARYDFVDNEYIGGIELLSEYTDNSMAYFMVSGGIGAHSSFSTLFTFDGTTVRKSGEYFSSAGGGAVTLADIDGDNLREIVADDTDYYIFCYACGVRSYSEIIHVWDGTAFVPQTLVDSADAQLQLAIDYARAGRWNMVTGALTKAAAPTSTTDRWNVWQLKRMVQARTPQAGDAFPLLAYVFYGDYDAAVNVLRQYPVADVVSEDGALIAGTTAEGFSDALVENVVRLTSTALKQDESLTSAQFLRGWALTLLDPRDPAGLADLQAVASANPYYAQVRDAVVGR